MPKEGDTKDIPRASLVIHRKVHRGVIVRTVEKKKNMSYTENISYIKSY